MNIQGKKKILHIVEAMGGGVFTYMVELANQLVETYDVYIAYATRPQTPENYMEYFDERIHLIEVEHFTREIELKNDYLASKEVRRIAKEINPAIIHVHSAKAGVIGRVVFGGRKIPLFYTPHGYSFLMMNCGNKKRFAYKAIEKFLGMRRCRTVSCSPGEYQEALGVTKDACFINNGIHMKTLEGLMNQYSLEQNKEIDNREKIDKIEKQFTVFTIGRICEQKNPALYNEVAKQLPEVQFLWIGDGELRHLLTSENIHITGWQTRDQALQYAMAADVFILPSLWEGLPISLLEAMYMKKVCIVSNVVGNRDVIQNDANGFVCDGVEDYVSVIQSLKNDDSVIAPLTAQARLDIEHSYNTIVMAEQYCAEYERRMRR